MTRFEFDIEDALPTKSKSVRLAAMLPAIEDALANGYSHKVIFDHIKNTEGIDMTFGYYQNTLHRLRLRRRNETPNHKRNASAFSEKPSFRLGVVPEAASNPSAQDKVDLSTNKPKAPLVWDPASVVKWK